MRNGILANLRSEYLANLRSRVFDEHKSRINEENRMSVVILLVFTFVIIVVNLCVIPITGGSIVNELIELAVYLVLAVVAFVFLRRDSANYTLLVYILELPLLLIALIMGTVFQPDTPAFSFLFFLLVLPSIVLDKPPRVLGFIWALGCLFAVLDFCIKPYAVFGHDMIHLLNTCLISSAECLCLLSARVKNIAYAEKFHEQTLDDSLTGLYNRAGAERYADVSEPGALLFIDLDNFKQVNDTFGHAEGDKVLKRVAETLRGSFRSEDVIVRMGGDEFAIFAKGRWNVDELNARLEQALERIEGIVVSRDGNTVRISASIGCVVETKGCRSFEEMVRLADEEMYRVKAHGKDGYHVESLD